MRRFLLTIAACGAFTLLGNQAFAHDRWCDHHHHHHHHPSVAAYSARPSLTVGYNAYYPGYVGYNVIPQPVISPYYPAPVYRQVVPTTVIEQPRTTFYYRGRGLSVGFGF